MTVSKRIPVLKFNENGHQYLEDVVVLEYPLTIYVGDKELVTISCTPEDVKELVIGFLKSDNIIDEYAEVSSCTVDLEKGHVYVELVEDKVTDSILYGKRYVTSGCASNVLFYDAVDAVKLKNRERFTSKLSLDIPHILKMMVALNDCAQLFKDTGGVHICGLADETGLVMTREDIGRHNSVDKVIGHMLINDVSPSDKMLVMTGRISSDMLLKSAKAGIGLVVSKSAPMEMAVRQATSLGIVLIGFARGKRATVYSSFDRLNIE